MHAQSALLFMRLELVVPETALLIALTVSNQHKRD